MKHTKALTLTALIISSTFSCLSPVQAAEEPASEVIIQEALASPGATMVEETNRLVVTLTEEGANQKQAVVEAAPELSETIDSANMVKDQVASDTSSIVIQTDSVLTVEEQEQVVSDLESDPRVESVEPSRLVKAVSASPTAEPHYPRLWAFGANYLNTPKTWTSGYTGKGVTVGIADTGFSYHPDLKNPVSSYDFVSDASISSDGNGRDADARDMGNGDANVNWHGTFIQGQINAQNNGQGVVGVAYDADVSVARVMGYRGLGWEDDMADGIVWLAGGAVAGAPTNPRPSGVINASFAWPSPTCSPIMAKAITYASNKNIPVVVAAGNSGVNANGISPANCYRAVVVGATTSWGTMTAYSNWGSMLDVVAPGGTTGSDIYSTTNTGFSSIGNPTYGNKNGTSMAAPFVTGTIAAMKQAYPGITLEQIRQSLTSTGKNVAGYKQVQTDQAVAKALSLKPVTQPSPSFRLVPRSGIEGAYYRYGGSAVFGVPTSNEFVVRDGGVVQNFSKNRTIYWTERTGAHPVVWTGGIGAKFRASGYENGYGFPLFAETGISGGAMQKFAKANGATTALYWSATHGRTHSVWEAGGIGGKFTRDGGTQAYGFPGEDETAVSYGARQTFTQGSAVTRFFWAPNTGVHLVNGRGAINALWESNGGVARHGFPATGEVRVTGGGVTQTFRTANGSQYLYTWSEVTGAHWMFDSGAIASHFKRTGGFATYGYPVTDEVHVGNGVYQVKFSKGKTISWSNARGIWVR